MMKRFISSTVNKRVVAQLAGRNYLPGSEGSLPKSLHPPRPDFPLQINCDFVTKDSLGKFAKRLFEPIPNMFAKYGAVFLRNMPIDHPEELDLFVKHSGIRSLPGRPTGFSGLRSDVNNLKRIATASEDHHEFCIEPHNEMGFWPTYPLLILLYCVQPATEGGESGITDVRDTLRDLDPNVVDKFRRLGIRYMRTLGNDTGYTTWQQALRCDTRAEAEYLLKQNEMQFIWNDDGSVTCWGEKPRPAFQRHHYTGETIWFNSVHLANCSYFKSHPDYENVDLPDDRYPTNTYYGDGSEIEADVLQHIREVIWKNTVGLRMEKGDMMILDNMLCQHSRLGYQGGERKVLVSLADKYY